MKIIVRAKFDRDTDNIHNSELARALELKILQIERALNVTRITGLKKLRGCTHHYRIKIETTKLSYRIGAIIRGDTIWLDRFLPRKKIYKKFP